MKAALLALSVLAAGPAATRAGHTRLLVKSVQERLVSHGYPAGYPDGRWCENTTDALREFQRESQISPTGDPDAATLEALFAGRPLPRGTGLAALAAETRPSDASQIERVRGDERITSAPAFPRQTFGLGAAMGFLLAAALSCIVLWRRRV